MSELSWILIGGLLMSLIAMVGSVTTMLPPSRLEQLDRPCPADFHPVDRAPTPRIGLHH